jgi:Family of unknown function (DUF6350)
VSLLVDGAFVAGLGLATLAALVLLLWTTSPYPDSGPGGALRVATGLWLLAHGAELVRTETLSDTPAPVGVPPLFLTMLPVFLLHQVARTAEGAASWVIGWLSVGYLAVGALVAWFSPGGSIRVTSLSVALHLPLFTVGVTVGVVWVARGCPAPPLPGWVCRARVIDALRAAGVATGALCGGGALLVAGALIWHGCVAGEPFPQLAGSWSGRVAVLLLCLAFFPNAAVWGAAYGLGPGFTLGAGSAVGPLEVSGAPRLPQFPLLEALPAEGRGYPLLWATAAAVPLAAGLAGGWYIGRASVPLRGSGHGAASWYGALAGMVLAAVGCGAALAALAVFTGGPLGSEVLADIGPKWWLTGAAALGWTALVGSPAALVVRLWRLREPHPLPAVGIGWRKQPDEGWHAAGARRSRWAELKRASGGLMADFEPRGKGE